MGTGGSWPEPAGASGAAHLGWGGHRQGVPLRGGRRCERRDGPSASRRERGDDLNVLACWAVEYEAALVIDRPGGMVALPLHLCWSAGVAVGYVHGTAMVRAQPLLGDGETNPKEAFVPADEPRARPELPCGYDADVRADANRLTNRPRAYWGRTGRPPNRRSTSDWTPDRTWPCWRSTRAARPWPAPLPNGSRPAWSRAPWSLDGRADNRRPGTGADPGRAAAACADRCHEGAQDGRKDRRGDYAATPVAVVGRKPSTNSGTSGSWWPSGCHCARAARGFELPLLFRRTVGAKRGGSEDATGRLHRRWLVRR
jgi:hypothetical protein